MKILATYKEKATLLLVFRWCNFYQKRIWFFTIHSTERLGWRLKVGSPIRALGQKVVKQTFACFSLCLVRHWRNWGSLEGSSVEGRVPSFNPPRQSGLDVLGGMCPGLLEAFPTWWDGSFLGLVLTCPSSAPRPRRAAFHSLHSSRILGSPPLWMRSEPPPSTPPAQDDLVKTGRRGNQTQKRNAVLHTLRRAKDYFCLN